VTTTPIELRIRAANPPITLLLQDSDPLPAGLTPAQVYPATPVSTDAGNQARLGTDLGIYVPPAVAGYVHVQASAAAEWTVNHNLGRRPLVAVTTIGGIEVETDVLHVSDSQARLTFASAFAGRARCV
jgi:hypothetical protein